MRNGWKKGAWLVIDFESGMTRYNYELAKDYTGLMVTKRYCDAEQPQDFVKGVVDINPLPFSNPSDQNFEVSAQEPTYVGNTNQITKMSPASHLFR